MIIQQIQIVKKTETKYDIRCGSCNKKLFEVSLFPTNNKITIICPRCGATNIIK
jgi:phage FluMu protein Com